MTYLFVFIGLFVLELLYFKVARFFGIIDKPNERSSHSIVTLRGGGIIFYLAALIYFLESGAQYPWFFVGLTLMTAVSFIDDIYPLSNKIRLLVHFLSVLLMAHELDVVVLPWFYLLITFVVIVGVINAYNFMDGINGITASNSLATGGLLVFINQKESFIDPDLLIYTMIGVVVFAFFNFRNRAKCFAGDVGSVSIAYILLFALGSLILKTENLIYFLLLAVYGVDTVWTILRRLYLKENIFEAHRSHLYQFLANEVGLNRLLISFLYGVVQLLIGLLVIHMAEESQFAQGVFSIALLVVLSVLYLGLKTWVIKRHVVISKRN